MTRREIGHCKDCKYWMVYDKEHICGYDNDYEPEETKFYADAGALDDTGLSCWIVTGPMFGCIHFVKGEK
jgi:hypothetical protein